MSSKAWIVSTVTSDIRIAEYAKQQRQNDVPVILRGFTIKGGANRAKPKVMLTENGVLTPVDAADLSWLMQNAEFQRLVREGWMTLITDDRDMNRALRDLQAKDGCAPLVDGDKRLDKARKVYVGDELPDGEVKAA